MWSIVAAVIGGVLALLNALLLFTLARLAARLDKQDAAITAMGKKHDELSLTITSCKIDCHRTFVTGEAFLRETGFMRRSLETQTASLNRMEGQFTLVEKLPAICGDISRAIVSEMKKDSKS
jgi:hypothetical protein